MSSESLPGQVSIHLHQKVDPDAHDAYCAWAQEIVGEAAKFPGHLGTHFMPPPPGENEYEISVRFASRDDAEYWLNSDIRRALLKRAEAFSGGINRMELRSGIDYWFSPPEKKIAAPKRWKQWLMTASIIWPMTLIMPRVLRPVLDPLPLMDTVIIGQLIIVLVMVYLVVYQIMPRYSRLLEKWLFR